MNRAHPGKGWMAMKQVWEGLRVDTVPVGSFSHPWACKAWKKEATGVLEFGDADEGYKYHQCSGPWADASR